MPSPGCAPGFRPAIGTSPRPAHTGLAALRGFVIVLVVAHHAAMGYNVALPTEPAASLADHLGSMHAISPVSDPARSDLLSLLGAFNDHFFMAILFLLSGLFVWQSLERKGQVGFLRDRLLRLGIPLIAMAAIRPLTYYPTYLQVGGSGGFSDFWQQWSAIEWRGGPIWFIELLLVFDLAVSIASASWRRVRGADRGRARSRSGWPTRPLAAFCALAFFSGLAYVPLTEIYGPFLWVQVGPAQLQANRIPFYAVYFVAGLHLGTYGLERSFLTPDSSLARRWSGWTVGALVAFVVSLAMSVGGANTIAAGLAYVIASAAISFAMLALFLRFASKPSRVFESLFENGYGIYVIHYGVVSWTLYAVLTAPLTAAAKWAFVFPGSLLVSWSIAATLRRVQAVARVL